MVYENVLLVGGPRDGEWLTVLRGVRSIRLTNRGSATIDLGKPAVKGPSSIDVFEYFRVPFRTQENVEGAAYVYWNLDLITTLLAGYRKPQGDFRQ